MKKKSAKLSLHRETVLQLDHVARGGVGEPQPSEFPLCKTHQASCPYLTGCPSPQFPD